MNSNIEQLKIMDNACKAKNSAMRLIKRNSLFRDDESSINYRLENFSDIKYSCFVKNQSMKMIKSKYEDFIQKYHSDCETDSETNSESDDDYEYNHNIDFCNCSLCTNCFILSTKCVNSFKPSCDKLKTML